MEQNNFNGQGIATTEEREPLPVFGTQPQNGISEPPVFTQTPTPASKNDPEVDQLADSAFGKCLCSAIMAQFPVCSIIAIFVASGGLKLVKKANDLAAQRGVSAGGKAIAAKVLGMYGKIAGIVSTALWCFITFFYILYFLILFLAYFEF